MRELKCEIMTIEQSDKSIMLDKFHPENDKKYALIFGNEVDGVSDFAIQYCDTCIEIPQFGMKHSLNVSVSAGIVLWDFVSKLKG